MNILILADSHGHPEKILSAVQAQVERPRAIFFLGDGIADLYHVKLDDIPVESVPGNCDAMTGGRPTVIITSISGVRFMLCHGHTLGVKNGLDKAIAKAALAGCDVLLFAHTHRSYEETISAGEMRGGVVLTKTLYVFNPGSIGDDSFGTLEIRNRTPMFGTGYID